MTISVDKRTNHSDQEPFQQWETRRVGSSKKGFYFSVLKKHKSANILMTN